MGTSKTSARVRIVSEFGFRLLERALIVGALKYGAKQLHSRSLEVLAWIALGLLVAWMSDQLWSFHDWELGTDKHPKGSPTWWALLVLTNLLTLLAGAALMGWLNEVTNGLVK
jgi:hypothetical protein